MHPTAPAGPEVPIPATASVPGTFTRPVGNPADPRFWGLVDRAYEDLLRRQRAADQHPWLLVQTLATSVSRRALYGAMGLQQGSRLLDVGTGFGPVAVEAAGAFGCQVVGLDVDPRVLSATADLRGDMQGAGWLAPRPTVGGEGSPPNAGAAAGEGSGEGAAAWDGTVSLAAGDGTRLPFADATFDVVSTRFVLQHLVDPAAAVAEMVRVVRPGGLVCVVDADDGLSISFPEPPEPIGRLQDAYAAAQQARGGDRLIGRKVAGLLDGAGVAVTAVLVLPQAAYGSASPGSLSQQLLLDRLSAFAGELVDRGILDEQAVRDGLHALATEEVGPRTVVDGHIAVLGRRRGLAGDR